MAIINNKLAIERALKDAARIGKQAAIRAMNSSLYNISTKHMPERIKTVFDRPTTQTTKAIKYKKYDETTKSGKLYIPSEGDATGYKSKDGSNLFYDSKYSFMLTQIKGGARQLKASEKRLQDAGILPRGMFIAPGQHMKLDRYGNIPKGEMTRIMSGLKAFGLSGRSSGFDSDITPTSAKRNKRAYSDLFYVNKKGKGQSTLPLGIYQRANEKRTARQLIIFIKQPHYKARFDFYNLASTMFDREIIKEMNKELSKRGGSAGPSSD